MKKPELLAPAGDLEKLKIALHYGADAVYVGGKQFSLRAQADNFDLEELAEGVAYTHARGKKLYLALNIFAHNEDIEQLSAYLQAVSKLGIDAVIVSDFGVLKLVKQYVPNAEIHISTQANNVNWLSAQVWKELGASRIILARELSLAEAGEIAEKAGMETELFVHGAMCMSYSGRCLLSNFLTGRDANRGSCVQSCRWKYSLVEEKRPGEYMPVLEDERGSYIMNSKDLCLLPLLPQLAESGINSWKIEGRNKSAYYVANVVRIYRAAIDAIAKGPVNGSVIEGWMRELQKVSHREYTLGFALGGQDTEMQRYGDSSPLRGYDFVATVQGIEDNSIVLQQRNHIALGDVLEILLPDGRNLSYEVREICNEAGEYVQAARHACEIFTMPLTAEESGALKQCEPPLIVRREAREPAQRQGVKMIKKRNVPAGN